MAEKSENVRAAVARLAEVTGWTPEKAEKHVVGLVDELANKADTKAKGAAQKVLERGKR